MRILVHIGYHKTGSTFLQRRLFKAHPQILLVNRQVLRRKFMDVSSLIFNPAAARAWLDEEIRSQGGGKQLVVISEEELSGNIMTGGNGGFFSKEMADRIHAAIPEARIVIMIRNQYDIIESVYRQYVKKGGTRGVKGFLFRRGCRFRSPMFHFDHFEYHNLIEYYRSIFGADEVQVFLHEEMDRNAPAFYDDFHSRLGIPVARDLAGENLKRSNERMSFISVALSRVTNRFSDMYSVNRHFFFHIPKFYEMCRVVYGWIDHPRFIKRIDRNRSFLNNSTRDFISKYYSPSNRALAEIIGVDLESHGYPV